MASRPESAGAPHTAQLTKETQLDAVRPNRTRLKAGATRPDSDSALRAKETQDGDERPKETQARAFASELFDASLIQAGMSTGEAAYLIGVSESVIRRMRSKDAREQVSGWQELLLPASYHLAKFDLLFMKLERPEGHVVRMLRAIGSLLVLAR